MILEFKDLPNNKNIKKISFEIEFEDGSKVTEIPRVTENIITFPNDNHHNTQNTPYMYDKIMCGTDDDTELKFNEQVVQQQPSQQPSQQPVQREAKPIPSEMTDLEL